MLAFVIVSLFGIILAAAYVGYTTAREFHTFADARNQASFLERWAQYYRLRGSWEGIENALASLWPPPPAPQARPWPGSRPNPRPQVRGLSCWSTPRDKWSWRAGPRCRRAVAR